MFRASWRSVSDPRRGHVCLSCLTRRFGGNARVRQFSTAPALRSESGDGPAGDASVQSTEPVTGSAIPKGTKPSPSLKSQPESATQTTDPNAEKASRKARKRLAARKGRKSATNKKGEKQPATESAGGSKELSEFIEKQLKQPRKKPEDAQSVSLSKIISRLQDAKGEKPGKTTTKADQEDGKNLAFLLNNMHKKDSGSLGQGELALTALDVETAPVPRLSFGLERVLFNPGVYHLRDPRSNVFNFDPYLGSIMPVTEFDFNALKEYITSSKDETLRSVAVKEKKKYVGSSSSMTSVLSQFHYLLSAWRGIDTRTLSQGFPDKLRTFTRLLRAPSAMFLRYQDGTYAIDADKEFDTANILMNLGKSMEKLLTLPKEDFERYRRSSTNKITPEEEQAVPESYHYSTLGDFVMRSQLDAYDPRLPGTGMFDLKTRAVVSIRMDAQNFEHGVGYEIKGQYGAFESYEREFFDMIRAAFLKYSLQVRVGRMDGIFVAFHNIQRIFGFQYVSLPEMDQTLHGQEDTALGDTEFKLSLGLWNKVLDKCTARFPERSLRFHFETRDATTPFMYIFAEPVTEDEITAIQTKNAAEINAFQERILNLQPQQVDEDLDAVENAENSGESLGQTEATSAQAEGVQASNSGESLDRTETNTSAQADGSTAAVQSGEAEANSNQPQVFDSSAPPDESLLTKINQESEEQSQNHGELLAMTLVIKNKVNGKLVERPSDFKSTDDWTVDYELTELPSERARALYNACQRRRQVALAGNVQDATDVANNVYIRKLREITKQGRRYRKKQDQMDQERGIVILDDAI